MAKGTASDLREQVELREGPEDRTIITFEYTYDLETPPKKRKFYSFVAVWVAQTGKWYSTGLGGGVPREATNDDLMKVLASENVKSAAVVTQTEKFKP
jgi:hypothetical protein